MKSIRQIISGIGVVWELPIALLSLIFYKLVKYSLRLLMHLYYFVRKDQALIWKFASEETLNMPGALPMIMTTGPRWNPHAIVATVGPISVKESLSLRVASPERSARSWTLVVCTFPGYQTVTAVGSLNAPFQNGSASLRLSPGRYWIGLRYYHWSNKIELPALTVDGLEVVSDATVPSDLNELYRGLTRRNNLFYLCLHYYVFVLLRYRAWFPKSFVEREFVPLGNPETHFYFGSLKPGESLSVGLDSALLRGHDVYLTVYNRASFPVSWRQITQQDFVTPMSSSDGFYLVRILKSKPLQHEFDEHWVKITALHGF